jgi:glycine cleavage system H protein
MKLYFTKDHEWVRVDGSTATVGISDYAQSQLGDVVFVENPPVGAPLTQGKEAAVVESVKAASEVYAPISGEVTEQNPALEGEPALVNTAPEDAGWFFRMTVKDPSELETLMDEPTYRAFVADL